MDGVAAPVRALVVDERGLLGDALQSILVRGVEVVAVARTVEQTFAAVTLGSPDLVLFCAWKNNSLISPPPTTAEVLVGEPHANGAPQGSPNGNSAPNPSANGNGSQHGSVNGNGALHGSANGNGALHGTTVPAAGPSRHELRSMADQAGLTLRERQVLALLVEGFSNKEMARRLEIRSNTARTHVQNVLTKLRVHNRLSAVALAMREGLVEGDRHDQSG